MSAVRFLRDQKCENGYRYREEVLSIDDEDRVLLAQSVPLVVVLLRSPRLQGVLSMLAKELLGQQSTRSGRQEVREFLRAMSEKFPTIVIDYVLSKDETDTYGYTPEVELEEGSELGNVMIRINGKVSDPKVVA
ncbi:hypothetical protein B9Z65_6489 [Elsinoe australis]|uniref:Uncharacterized protein n=1 Tax=Elsinoe australis TaxID=40998 RepID=A0A2P8A8S5_9PEZI|nr:hypothetical protein B9Z65_6489 [Elsinoe australis]